MALRRRAAVLLVLAVGLAAAYAWRVGREPAAPRPPATPALEESLREDAVITWRVEYQECGGVEEFSTPAAGMAGWSRDRLAAAMPQWRLESFSPAGALLVRSTPGLCPDMQVYRTITWHAGRVAIFYGRPPHLKLKEITGVDPASLPEPDRLRLDEGVVVRGDEGVLQLLEGLDD